MMMNRTGLLGMMLVALLALAACNSTDATLGVTPSDIASQGEAPGVQPTTPSEAAKASARLYIAPIIGSTVAAVTPLSRRLTAVAPANDLAIVADADPSKTFVVKGYFSALPENGSTTIVFVWDVFDPAGVRQHRIQGQETVAGTASDPWSIVPPALMEKIADRTIADFKAWQGGVPTVAKTTAPVVDAVTQPAAPGAPATVAPAKTAVSVPAAVTAAPSAPTKPSAIPTVPAPPPSISN